MSLNLKNKLLCVLLVPVKKALNYIFYLFQDIISYIKGTNLKGYPPERLNFVGRGEFKKIGDEFVKYFIDLGDLKSSDTVLDIGCGIGRIAIPLTKYLITGELYGFDIDKRGIKWCKNNISNKFSNFHFQYIDIFNTVYNKKGKIHADKFIFPYDDNRFDFIFATSVLTHMLPKQVTRYLGEIRRVLKPKGKCFLTWFSIDEEAQNNISEHRSNCNFIYPYGEDIAFYSHKNFPEAEIGYKESWIIEQLKKYDLYEKLKIYHGSWANRKENLSYQDIFVSEKKEASII